MKQLTEQAFMESLLNMKESGYSVECPFLFYAFFNQFHIDKFSYYCELLEIRK